MRAPSGEERPPSCRNRAPGAGGDCGPTGADDCCARADVPAGTVLRAYDDVECTDDRHPATVSAFALDVFEVTVGRFRAFLDAGHGTRAQPPAEGAGAHPRHLASGWRAEHTAELAPDRASLERALACGPAATWTAEPGDDEQKPINCVTFYEALAFCAWDGGHLPTEAERNHVASGGEEHRVYPWSAPPSSTAIEREHAVFGAAGPLAVGTHRAGDGRWGHADLAGNVWEWTLDTVSPDAVLPTEGAPYCSPAGLPMPCDDCVAAGGDARVLRGGGWGLPDRGMAVAIRRGGLPGDREHVFGFRCARSCVGAGCEQAVAYPSGPYGIGSGDVAPNLALRAIVDARAEPDVVATLSLARYYADARAEAGPRALVLYLAAGWAPDDPIAALASGVSADARVRLLVVLLEGDRRGQPADAGNLRAWATQRDLAIPVAMDVHRELAALIGDRATPELVVVDLRTMRVAHRGPATEAGARAALAASRALSASAGER